MYLQVLYCKNYTCVSTHLVDITIHLKLLKDTDTLYFSKYK